MQEGNRYEANTVAANTPGDGHCAIIEAMRVGGENLSKGHGGSRMEDDVAGDLDWMSEDERGGRVCSIAIIRARGRELDIAHAGNACTCDASACANTMR